MNAPFNEDMPLEEAVPRNSKYVGKEDVDPPIVVQIAYMTREDVETDRGAQEKTILYFNGDIKPLIVNSSNNTLLMSVTGVRTPRELRGKQIVLWNDPTVMYKGKLTGGVRIRSADQPLTAQQPYAAPQGQTPPNAGPGSQDFDDSIPY